MRVIFTQGPLPDPKYVMIAHDGTRFYFYKRCKNGVIFQNIKPESRGWKRFTRLLRFWIWRHLDRTIFEHQRLLEDFERRNGRPYNFNDPTDFL